MARVAVPVVSMSQNAGTSNAGTPVDTTNHHALTISGDGRVLIEVDNTGTVATATVTVKAGDNPPAFRAGLGDLAVVVGTAGLHRQIIIVETARFLQDDGTINIDAAGFSAGTIVAYQLPRSF